MEIEMKYSIPTEEMAGTIWDELSMSEMADTGSAEKIVMKAVYFDTDDMDLAAHNVTVRVRAEGERSFATLKWGGKSELGLHEREEVNIPISGEEFFIQPPADMFRESETGLDLVRIIGDKQLRNLLETRFLRRRIRIFYSGSLIELAIDTGKIITDNGERRICELELELYNGSTEAVRDLGERIAQAFGLEPENKSKFARGLELLRS
ncbi:MAG: CYTH domain-containing protein [Firmicutes bacterium]|nr:CYTH domain-containing protein [Bacillota bacterium]